MFVIYISEPIKILPSRGAYVKHFTADVKLRLNIKNISRMHKNGLTVGNCRLLSVEKCSVLSILVSRLYFLVSSLQITYCL